MQVKMSGQSKIQSSKAQQLTIYSFFVCFACEQASNYLSKINFSYMYNGL
jgi:hypothetical protein